MSNCYRRIFIALAGLIFLCGAQQPNQRQSTERATNDATDQIAEPRAVSPIAELAATPAPKPSVAQAARDQSYYSREDLKAQREMAKWTRYMGMAAIVGVVLSMVGVGLVYTTFAETRKANVIAKMAAEAAQKDARASRDALVLAERAIVTIEAVRFGEIDLESRSWPVTMIVGNEGRSNAHKFRLDYLLSSEPVFRWKFTEFRNIPALGRPGKPVSLQFDIRRPKFFPTSLSACFPITRFMMSFSKATFAGRLPALQSSETPMGTAATPI